MPVVLALNSSLSGEASVSKHLVREAVSHLRTRNPFLHLIARDLGENPLPHLTGHAFQGFVSDRPDDTQKPIRDLADVLIAEIQAADVIIIGAPMYNLGIHRR